MELIFLGVIVVTQILILVLLIKQKKPIIKHIVSHKTGNDIPNIVWLTDEHEAQTAAKMK